jgi:hypothetical protein
VLDSGPLLSRTPEIRNVGDYHYCCDIYDILGV